MTFPILPSNGPSGYNLTRSLRFRSSASAYLNRTPASAGNRSTWTFSAWMKLGTFIADNQFIFCANSGAPYCGIYLNSSNALTLTLDAGTANTTITTSAVFRDPAAWYHVVVYLDTTQATAANRWAIYVNNVLQPVATVATPAQNSTWNINNTVIHTISTKYASGSSQPRDGYLTEVNFIDGQALTPSSFGSTNTLTGVWQPARYTGTYGTNGFYLPFTDNSGATATTIGKDFSGNGNNWTPNNISVTAGVTYDSMTDVPTLTSATAANFAVLNRLFNTPAEVGLSAGNLNYNVGASTTPVIAATIGVSTGKWYWEVTATSAGNNIGIISLSDTRSLLFVGGSSNSWAYFHTGIKYGNSVGTAYGASYTTNDVIGVALDLTAGTITFYKNNTSQGTAFSSLSGTFFPACGNDGTTSSCIFNFGQRPFTYTAPTGFVALNTFNLPTSTIVKGNTVMDATLYTGNGSTQTITNAAGFKPDLVWQKTRSNVNQNILNDSVRGVSRTIYSNLTNAEAFYTGYNVTAFNSNGFSVGDDSAGAYGSNGTGQSYVGWQWQAGQGTTSSNTSGSITSTVSVNASAGFSVVTYTGTAVAGTIGHGLGVAPQLIIVKPRSATITTDAWNVYHVSTGNTNFLVLNATDALAAASNRWNNTSPTSSVFSIGTVPSSVAVGYVAYCWTPIAGYSSFGSYVGNGSTDGPFLYLGFRPKYLLLKCTTTGGAGYDWYVLDSVRNAYNYVDNYLYPNYSNAEAASGASYSFDFVSNGIKIRGNGNGQNQNGQTYAYACWAENPFKNALAR